MNFTGLICAAVCFVATGLGFLWVIKLEYHIGARVAPVVLIVGLVLAALSAFMPGFWTSCVTGIFAGTVIWGSGELRQQAERVAAGHFPSNPEKKDKSKKEEE